MSLVTAQNSQAQTFTGTVAHELMNSGASTNSLNTTARNIAAYFMANMDSDEFKNDQAHSTNLAVGAGIVGFGAGVQFANVDGSFKAPAPAPDKSGNVISGGIG